ALIHLRVVAYLQVDASLNQSIEKGRLVVALHVHPNQQLHYLNLGRALVQLLEATEMNFFLH
ncbi:MAG TPA: hypothetical protein VFM18_07485, partial [Methanosarcina sp.]|nr:hypothetical protein [Methanosarcina sp.]